MSPTALPVAERSGAAGARAGGGVRPASGSRALVRKDLLLELRGRELVPAMVVFVLAAFVLFRLAWAATAWPAAPGRPPGLLWVAVVFTAMLGLCASLRRRARAPAVGRPAGGAGRPGRDLARAEPLSPWCSWSRCRWWRCRCSGSSSCSRRPAPSYPGAGRGAAAGRRGDGGAGRAAGRPGLRGARPRGAAAGALPALRACRSWCVAVQPDDRHDSPANGRFGGLQGLGFLALYDTIFALLGWALFEYVVED